MIGWQASRLRVVEMMSWIPSFAVLDGWLRGMISCPWTCWLTLLPNQSWMMDRLWWHLREEHVWGRHPEQRHVFQFGKYRNESYEDVTEETPDYYFWGSHERKQSKYLQHYWEWVTEHYDVDPVRCTLTSKATGRILEAKPSPTKGQKQAESQLKKSLRQEGWKRAAKCVLRCDPRHATRAGSNATHVRFTCLQCGTVTQGKREEPLTRSPKTCPHENTDARGSSSTTHRVYSKDCGSVRL